MDLISIVPRFSATALLLAAAAGCARENVFEPPPPPQVTVQRPVQREVTLYKDFVGRTEASETVEIRARVKGFLETIDFQPSQLVAVGDLLFTIEPESFLAVQASAQAAIDQAKAARDLARVTLDRAQVAYDKEAVSDLEMMEKRAQLDAAEAQVRAAEAELETASLDLSYTTIRAPIAGRVSREYVTIGNLVGSPDATLLTTIIKDDPIYAYFNINERELLPFLVKRRHRDRPERPVVPARLQLSDGRDYEHEGEIDFADNTVDAVTGTIQARAKLPNPVGGLIPGLFVRVLLPQEAREVMLVPEVALQRDLAGPYLLIVNGEDAVERRDVDLGDRLKDLRIIESGLEGSEAVIVKGLQRARPGVNVAPQEEAPDDAAILGDETPEESG